MIIKAYCINANINIKPIYEKDTTFIVKKMLIGSETQKFLSCKNSIFQVSIVL